MPLPIDPELEPPTEIEVQPSCLPILDVPNDGHDDGDGCPDGVPDEVTKALATGAKLKFEPNRARVTLATRTALQPLLAMLSARPDVRISITGRPATARDADHERAARARRRRARSGGAGAHPSADRGRATRARPRSSTCGDFRRGRCSNPPSPSVAPTTVPAGIPAPAAIA